MVKKIKKLITNTSIRLSLSCSSFTSFSMLFSFNFARTLARLHTTIHFTYNAQFSVVLFTALSPDCTQRGGGFARWRGTQILMRVDTLQVFTKRSAALHPPLRVTACCRQAFRRSKRPFWLITILSCYRQYYKILFSLQCGHQPLLSFTQYMQ